MIKVDGMVKEENEFSADVLKQSFQPRQEGALSVPETPASHEPEEHVSDQDKVQVQTSSTKGVHINIKRFLVAGLVAIGVIGGGLQFFHTSTHIAAPAAPVAASAPVHATPAPVLPPAPHVQAASTEPTIPDDYASRPHAEAMQILETKEAWLNKQLSNPDLSPSLHELYADKVSVLQTMKAAL